MYDVSYPWQRDSFIERELVSARFGGIGGAVHSVGNVANVTGNVANVGVQSGIGIAKFGMNSGFRAIGCATNPIGCVSNLASGGSFMKYFGLIFGFILLFILLFRNL